MPVYIELTTLAFDDAFIKNATGKKGRTSRAGAPYARRPLRGIEIKEDTYAALKVIGADGRDIPIVDSSSVTGMSNKDGYTNFILQSVKEERMEKHQILETFGQSYVFFFGEDPRFLDCTATLLNTHDFNWKAEWMKNYNDYFRGTRLVELGARVYLFYDDNILEGYMLNTIMVENAMNPYHVQLAFKFFVTNYQNISLLGPPDNNLFPIRSTAIVPQGVELTAADSAYKMVSFLQDVALMNAEADHLRQYDQLGAQQLDPFADYKKITDAYRSAARSFSFSPDVFKQTENLPPGQKQEIINMVARYGFPIRSRIIDNIDEFTGVANALMNPWIDTDADPVFMMPSAIIPTVRDINEVEDLFRESIQMLSCYGANINNPSSMDGLGLGVSFTASVGIGGGASASFGASAKASANASAGFGASAGASAGVGITSQYDQFAKDPLGSVYGPSSASGDAFGPNRPKYKEGVGAYAYGYASAFAGGQPGYGQSGFGDFGGYGFGSGQGGGGDPGFKDPSKFTFAGVADNRSSFDRFMTPKQDSTALSKGGSGIGFGASGGASLSVGGKVSAFAMISVDGVLDPTGQARQNAEAVAERLRQTKFGFSVDNPFGVQCPQPDQGCQETETGYQCNYSFEDHSGPLTEGFNYTLP